MTEDELMREKENNMKSAVTRDPLHENHDFTLDVESQSAPPGGVLTTADFHRVT
jgi:hypothetical protein